MRFLRFIDKKIAYSQQKAMIISFLFIGVPTGFIVAQIIMIISVGWSKYHFNLSSMTSTLILDALLISPLIINYLRHKKKYKNIINHIDPDDLLKIIKVKSLFDFDNFTKGQSYIINFAIMPRDKKFIILVIDNNNSPHILKRIINKFELDNIKEERLKKLKKLKRRWW